MRAFAGDGEPHGEHARWRTETSGRAAPQSRAIERRERSCRRRRSYRRFPAVPPRRSRGRPDGRRREGSGARAASPRPPRKGRSRERCDRASPFAAPEEKRRPAEESPAEEHSRPKWEAGSPSDSSPGRAPSDRARASAGQRENPGSGAAYANLPASARSLRQRSEGALRGGESRRQSHNYSLI
jgi:hypothetical protein